MLPQLWKEITLGELVTSFRGGTSFRTFEYSNDGAPVLTKGDVKPYGLVKHGGKYVDRDYAIEKGYKFTSPKDLIITTRDLTLKADFLGLVSEVPESISFLVNQGANIFTIDETLIDRRYLVYWCSGIIYRHFIKNNHVGATQIHMRKEDIFRAPIWLPPHQTQINIAAHLDLYTDLIKNNTRRIQILEEMAQRIYCEWFVHFRYPGHKDDDLVHSGTELGMIPEGWKAEKIENLTTVFGGGTPSTKMPEYWHEGNIHWYSPTDLTKSASMWMTKSIKKINHLGLRKSSAKLFPAKSVMLTSRATIGVISINFEEACTNQGFITCVPSERFPLHMTYYWMINNVDKFINLASGATFKELPKSTFRVFDAILPPKEIVSLFGSTVLPMMDEILTLFQTTEVLKQTRDLLLPKLISGQVDVSDRPIDSGDHN